MKKRLLSVVVCICVILAQVTPMAFAVEKNFEEEQRFQAYFLETNVSADLLDSAVCGAQLLSEASISTKNLTAIEMTPAEELVYCFDFGDTTAKIIPAEHDDGILLKISEGSLYNELLLTENNEVYINGKRVEYGVTDEDIKPSMSTIPNTELISPRQLISYGGWTEICPYGYASAYSYYARGTNSRSLQLQEQLIALGLTTFTVIVIQLISPGSAVDVDAFNDLYNSMVQVAPYSDEISCIGSVYYHNSTNEFWIINTATYRIGAEKHLVTCYSEPNYGGTTVAKTLFSYVEYR